MPRPEGVWCECGCRITIHHVLQHGFVMSHWVPQFVYIKYQCSNCGRTGQELLEFKSWDPAVLDVPLGEPCAPDSHRLAKLGTITEGEVSQFARELRLVESTELERMLSDS